MQSARLAIQIAVGNAAEAALLAQGLADAADRVYARKAPEQASYPLVIIGDGTEVRGLHSDKDAAEAEDTHTCRVYSTSSTEAIEIAELLVGEVTGAEFAVAGFALQDVRLDMMMPAPSEIDPRYGDVFGEIVRFRIRTYTTSP